MGPIAFILVFLLVPLAAALFAGAFFGALAVVRLLAAVPTGAWAALAVAAGVLLTARLWQVLRVLRRATSGTADQDSGASPESSGAG